MRRGPWRRSWWGSAAATVWLAMWAGPVLAQDAKPTTPKTSQNLLKPETNRAIAAGLAYLQQRQNDDGSFGGSGLGRNVGVCGLAGMAMLASGSTPGRGPYGREVNRCVAFLLDHTLDSGFVTYPDAVGHGPMYGHGFATLFLAEVHGMSPDPLLREKLSNSVKLILSTQNDEGGWRYEPKRQDADISVTVCQVMALRAARNAGIFVPNKTIDRCTDYVKRSQNADGGFMYQLTQPGVSQFPRSAAAVVGLYSAGIYAGPEVERGLDYLMKHLSQADAFPRDNIYFFYGHYYAVQAMWQAGGERWQRWYPAIHDALLARQKQDGSWPDNVSYEYGTAMACLILQMPNNYLPIFQH